MSLWPNRIREIQRKKQNNFCYWCGVGFSSTNVCTADHVIPRSEGGDDSIDNIVAACLDCNQWRGVENSKKINSDAIVDEFMEEHI